MNSNSSEAIRIHIGHSFEIHEILRNHLNFSSLFCDCRVLLSVIGFLIIVATIHDWVQTYFKVPTPAKSGSRSGRAVEALHCFSALSNGRKLLAPTAATSQNFACLNGIRVISTTWVVMGHTYYALSFARVTNLPALAKVN